MIAARFINPFYRLDGDSTVPDRFDYELVIINLDTTEIYERTAKSYPWSVSDAELEDIGAVALAEYVERTGAVDEQSFAPPVLDWPEGGPI